MIRKLTEVIIKFKWAVVFIWVVAAVILFLSAPKLSDIVRTDNGGFLPANSKTAQADKLVKSLFPNNAGQTSLVLVASSEQKLSTADLDYIKNAEKYFTIHKKELTLLEITSPFTSDAMKSQLISKDSKVALVYLKVNAAPYSEVCSATLTKVKAVITAHKLQIDGANFSAPATLQMYTTGDAAIGSEQHQTTNTSMAIVTRMTIILLLLILIFIYRSPVAPLLPLFTIGTSFIISRGIIGFLTYSGFKISTFTETFLIAVLFGAGTDYCMLIISRFKEELSHGKDKNSAILDAMPNTGEAIISSGGTVVVGFLFMIFAQFGLFNTTGPSVAIGVVITILAVLTLIPALISIIGEKIFWPTKNFESHNSKLHGGFWSKLAAFVTAKPIRFLVISVAIFVPFIISATGLHVSYDSMKDLPASNPSIKGFTVMSEHFQKGDLLPVRITIKSNKNMYDTNILKTTDLIADNLLKLDNVQVVRSASRPLGEKLTQTSLGSQVALLSGGMQDVNKGFSPLKSGLDTIKSSIDKIEKGINDGSTALSGKLAGGADQLISGSTATKDGLDKLNGGTVAAVSGISQITTQLKTLSDGTAKTNNGIGKVSDSIDNSIASLNNLLISQPTLQTNVDFQTAYGTLKAVSTNLAGIEQSLSQIKDGISKTADGLTSVGAGVSKVGDGIKLSATALTKINDGITAMKKGALSASAGLDTAADALSKVSSGIDPINEGLSKIANGLSKVNDVTSSYSTDLKDVFYLPSNVFTEYPKFKEAVSNYMSPDGHGTTFDVILSVTPYSTAALDTIKDINNTIKFSLKNTNLEGATFATTGITSTYSEIRGLINTDLITVIVFVLLGIFVVLAILLRSLVAPIYLMLTIVLSYVSTLGISFLFFCKILGQDGLHWSVPFFSFCVLVALGVDYNIFLMSRVKEEYVPGQMRQSVTRALATTGGIITSCGVIMAGTFGSMMFSPLRPMMQIGFAACVGLIIDTFIIRSIVVPAIAVLIGEMSWWPGRKIQVTSSDRKKK